VCTSDLPVGSAVSGWEELPQAVRPTVRNSAANRGKRSRVRISFMRSFLSGWYGRGDGVSLIGTYYSTKGRKGARSETGRKNRTAPNGAVRFTGVLISKRTDLLLLKGEGLAVLLHDQRIAVQGSGNILPLAGESHGVAA